jgi:hypothetical protein
MPDRLCPHCRQPLPPEARRDTLPPLDHPAVVTIHDLPEGAGEVEGSSRRLAQQTADRLTKLSKPISATSEPAGAPEARVIHGNFR